MKDLLLTLTAQEPLVITSGSAESMAHDCLGYVPGNMVLGAMAVAWKRAHPGKAPDDDAEFHRLFLNGEVSWGHAVPLCEGSPAVPIPLCFGRVKNHAALPLEGTDFEQDEYMVFNYLAINEGQKIQELWQERHPQSEEKIKTKKMPAGFMNPKSLHQAVERRVWNIHVALGDRRSALDGQLFGYSALAEGTLLQARVICHTEEARQALEELVGSVSSLNVGHSRSAGYGRVKLEAVWQEQDVSQRSEQKDFNLFFLSQYLPMPSWEAPLENLERELVRLTGQKPDIGKSFTGFAEIQGYNGLWKRPRTSRLALAAGSVIRVSFAKSVTLPVCFSLGSGQIEGYGRVLCNPDFLRKTMPDICRQKAVPVEHKKREAATSGDPLWRLLRERTAARHIEAQVTKWLHDEEWQKFLKASAENSHPTASQRNNLRDINVENFRKMLDKTPGKQWKQAASYCPFTHHSDHLSEIMLKLLDPAKFGQTYQLDQASFVLPGGDIEPDERELFNQQAHRLFVRRLISIWGKISG